MQSRRPAPLNVVQGDSEGTTWALPEGAIARFGKGIPKFNEILAPGGTYFAVATRMGLWWYEMSSKPPIALWETERGLIASAHFSPNGEWIAIANWDGILKVMDVQSGECLAQMKRMEEQNIYAHVVFSADCKWIATANQDGIVEVLDVHRGVCVAQMDRGERETESNDVSQLEFSSDCQFLAATVDNPKIYSSHDGKLINPDTEGTQTYVWHPEIGEVIAKFAGRSFVFSPDSRLLAGVASDETVNDTDRVDRCVSVWNLITGERIAHFTEHTDWINTIAFSPCGEFLVSSSTDKSLRVWDIGTGVQKMVYANSETSWKEPFYSQEGELLASVDRQDTTEIWNVERCEKLYTLELHPRSINAKWFRRFPQLALANIRANATPIQTANVSNIHTSSTIHEFVCYPDPILFSPDGTTLVAKGDRNGIMSWDVARKQVTEILLEGKRISSFTALPCGKMLAASIRDKNVKVWDVAKPDEPVVEFTEQAQLVWNMAFALTGDRLAVGSREGTIYLYDLKCNVKLKPLTGHSDFIWSVSISPDSKRLATGSTDKTARLWDVESGEEIATFPLGEPRTLMEIAFSPCGSVIAGGMFGELRLWCAETLTTLFSIPHPRTQKPYALAFSPCGRYLASGTWWQIGKGMKKMTIQLWSVETGENITTFRGHPTDVQALAFSPDNTLLASGSHDGTILLWDVKPFIEV